MIDRLPLKGKIAVVTGAGRGIGSAVAEGYAAAGAAVACAARTVDEIESLADRIRSQNGLAVAVETDVTKRASVANLFEKVSESFGGIDIVVVNAGVNTDRNTVEDSDPDAWETTIAVNLFGAYYTIQAAIPYLKARGGGKIITVGSGLGHKGSPKSSAYSCSKAGLWMLARIAAMELRQYNISVNELIPGPVHTTMDRDYDGKTSYIPEVNQEWVKDPEDVAPMALFLAMQPDLGPTAQSFSLMRRDG